LIMKTSIKAALLAAACIIIFLLSVGLGSVSVGPGDVARVILHKLFGLSIEGVPPLHVTIIWTMRLPRVVMAFIVGIALGLSGTVMQSVLQNPLASSYTLGVSSGASLGAYLVMITGFSLPLIGSYTLPLFGFIFGFFTVIATVALAGKIDGGMQNHTIVLAGMVFSLFVSAVLSFLSAFFKDTVERLVFWQLGTFSLKDWSYSALLLPIVAVCTLIALRHSREMDIMTFGGEQAMAMGVELKKVKWILLITAAAMTGSAISLVGIIGFVDLIAPHVARRFFGSRHSLVLPASAAFSGAFMMLCDLAARTIVSPSELPIGSITALIGAPFFAYIYFAKGGRKNA
jgi:iron complex transport system permease protein